MSGQTYLKRFFKGSRVTDSFSGGQSSDHGTSAHKRRPGARAMLAAGVASFMLMAGALSPAWAQETLEQGQTGPETQVEEVQPDAQAPETAMDKSPMAGWLSLVVENCDVLTAPGSGQDNAGQDPSFADNMFAMLDKSELGKALHSFAAEKNILICNNPSAGIVDWDTMGSRRTLSTSPDYQAHPRLPPLGEGGAAFAISLQLRMDQHQSAGNVPSPQMAPADALLINRLVRMDVAMYLAETALDLKYNHDDDALYNGIRSMARFERNATLSSSMISALEEQAIATQPENVKTGEGENARPELTGIDLNSTLRRAALDVTAEKVTVRIFDDMVLSGYEAYINSPGLMHKAPPFSVEVTDEQLVSIGNRPGDEDGTTYLSGGRDLRTGYYIQTESVGDAMRMADILLRLSGELPPHPDMPDQLKKDKPRTYQASARSL